VAIQRSSFGDVIAEHTNGAAGIICRGISCGRIPQIVRVRCSSSDLASATMPWKYRLAHSHVEQGHTIHYDCVRVDGCGPAVGSSVRSTKFVMFFAQSIDKLASPMDYRQSDNDGDGC
jgi:hypothetical protein